MRERATPGGITGGGGRRSARAVAVLFLALAVSGCGASGPATDDPAGPDPSASPAASPSPASPSPATPTPARPTPTSDPASWPLVWSDEFDGPAGSPPDPATWGYDLGDGSAFGLVGWGNNERQSYTDSPDNVALDGNGNLLLTVRPADGTQPCYYGPCEYTSARVLTKGLQEFQYGRLEIRFKVPDGFGLWPAIWLLGTNIDEVSWPASGEIDVMEFVGRRPNEILGTMHGPGYWGSSGYSQTLDLGRPVFEDFHVAAIEWWPGHIAWFLDGEQYHEATPADVAPNEWAFDHPFYLLLNVAVGGNLGGPVSDQLVLPASMAIDYVRLYREDGL